MERNLISKDFYFCYVSLVTNVNKSELMSNLLQIFLNRFLGFSKLSSGYVC